MSPMYLGLGRNGMLGENESLTFCDLAGWNYSGGWRRTKKRRESEVFGGRIELVPYVAVSPNSIRSIWTLLWANLFKQGPALGYVSSYALEKMMPLEGETRRGLRKSHACKVRHPFHPFHQPPQPTTTFPFVR